MIVYTAVVDRFSLLLDKSGVVDRISGTAKIAAGVFLSRTAMERQRGLLGLDHCGALADDRVITVVGPIDSSAVFTNWVCDCIGTQCRGLESELVDRDAFIDSACGILDCL